VAPWQPKQLCRIGAGRAAGEEIIRTNQPTKLTQMPTVAESGVVDAQDALERKEYDEAVKAAQSSLPGQPAVPPLLPRSMKLSDIRAHLPAHLFERSAATFLWHVGVDLSVAAGLLWCATWLEQLAPGAGPWWASGGWWASVLLWPVYWVAQGVTFTSVWVLAHEAGHQAASDSKLFNDVMGTVLHSALLVPYHPWRISHANHHKNTCSIENDEVFVPEEGMDAYSEAVADTPLQALAGIVRMLVIGWPAYLIGNFSGPKKYANKPNDHFRPWSALFRGRDAMDVAASDLALAAFVALLCYLGWTLGAWRVGYYYLMPYLVVNAHLVLITYLQHTDTFIPHYREAEFTFERGALATVDRSFGWLIDDRFHHIADTHVCHHLFSTMPFYNAVHATPILQRVLGDFYLRDDTPIPTALYRAWTRCKFVEKTGDVVFLQTLPERQQ
jgi:omega-6 fatty acid desaturase / acyl-lipid omega-6 desaturase (Delta-12 desaturase)